MTDIDLCNVCGRPISPGKPECWMGPDGETVGIINSLLPSALIESREGDVYICGNCYPDQVERSFNGEALAELHYQFGLDHLRREDNTNAAVCLRRAVAIHRSADYLAALAVAVDSLEESIRLNREALTLDPDCSIARNNLAKDEAMPAPNS